jgi:hypothetical protein
LPSLFDYCAYQLDGVILPIGAKFLTLVVAIERGVAALFTPSGGYVPPGTPQFNIAMLEGEVRAAAAYRQNVQKWIAPLP